MYAIIVASDTCICVSCTGQRRQALEAFVAAFGVGTHNSGTNEAISSDPVLQVNCTTLAVICTQQCRCWLMCSVMCIECQELILSMLVASVKLHVAAYAEDEYVNEHSKAESAWTTS